MASFTHTMWLFNRWPHDLGLGTDGTSPFKLIFEVERADDAAKILHSINKEVAGFMKDSGEFVVVDLNKPFQFYGITIEFRLKKPGEM